VIGFIRTALLYSTLGLLLAATMLRVAEEAIGFWVVKQVRRV
jgi:hypothetical protein